MYKLILQIWLTRVDNKHESISIHLKVLSHTD